MDDETGGLDLLLPVEEIAQFNQQSVGVGRQRGEFPWPLLRQAGRRRVQEAVEIEPHCRVVDAAQQLRRRRAVQELMHGIGVVKVCSTVIQSENSLLVWNRATRNAAAAHLSADPVSGAPQPAPPRCAHDRRRIVAEQCRR